MLRFIGFPYSLLEIKGFMLPVLELNIKYRNPAYYDDLLLIRSFVKQIPVLKIHIDYTIHREDGNILVAEGFTEHVFMKKENRKAVRPPEFFLKAIKPFYQDE